MTREELTAWIAERRGRLERGELYSHPPLQLLPWLRISDVDCWREQPQDARLGSAPIGIQRRIATELAALYERLVEGKPCAPPDWSPMGPPRDW
jgi:hypothetical protein